MKKFLIIPALILSYMIAPAQKHDRKLERQIASLLKGFNGQAGVYVKNLRNGKRLCINADTIFPTASMIKVPILAGVMNKMEKKELHYHQEMVYNDSLVYEGADILASFKSGEKIEIGKLLMLMLTTSDNTASLWLQSLAGGGDTINRLLDSLGFTYTRVNSRTAGRETNKMQYGWGQTTPREVGQLLEDIYKRKIISKNASEKMIRLLGRNYWDDVALSQIPPAIFTASKNGAVDESRSETVLVMAPKGPYIFSVITKNNKDVSWDENNEAWVLTRKISALLWNYHAPGYGWKPAE